MIDRFYSLLQFFVNVVEVVLEPVFLLLELSQTQVGFGQVPLFLGELLLERLDLFFELRFVRLELVGRAVQLLPLLALLALEPLHLLLRLLFLPPVLLHLLLEVRDHVLRLLQLFRQVLLHPVLLQRLLVLYELLILGYALQVVVEGLLLIVDGPLLTLLRQDNLRHDRLELLEELLVPDVAAHVLDDSVPQVELFRFSSVGRLLRAGGRDQVAEEIFFRLDRMGALSAALPYAFRNGDLIFEEQGFVFGRLELRVFRATVFLVERIVFDRQQRAVADVGVCVCLDLLLARLAPLEGGVIRRGLLF